MLGSADGAFLLLKEKRTDNRAVLDVVGRDQQDQRLHLLFARERCIWQIIRMETELWKESSEPIREAIALLMVSEVSWVGNASELADALQLYLMMLLSGITRDRPETIGALMTITKKYVRVNRRSRSMK